MKNSLCFGIAAILPGCIVSLAFAQAQAPSARLVALQLESSNELSFWQDESDGIQAVSDPASLPNPNTASPGQNPVDAIIANSAPSHQEQSHQGSYHHSTTRPGALQAQPQVLPGGPDGTYFAPTHWSGAHSGTVPNAFVDYLSQQWCVDGLWDGYGAERAAECALQNRRISGACKLRHSCGHCTNANGVGYHAFNGDCCPRGCFHRRPSCDPCNACAAAPVNRYRSPTMFAQNSPRPAHAMVRLDDVPTVDNSVLFANAPEHSILTEVELTESILETSPVSSPVTAEHVRDDKVAFLPANATYR